MKLQYGHNYYYDIKELKVAKITNNKSYNPNLLYIVHILKHSLHHDCEAKYSYAFTEAITGAELKFVRSTVEIDQDHFGNIQEIHNIDQYLTKQEQKKKVITDIRLLVIFAEINKCQCNK